jgi:hypothetical protein
MGALKSIALLVVLALPAFAQEGLPDDRELGRYKGGDDSVRSIANYCESVDDFSREQAPRIFAEVKQGGGDEFDPARWKEFSDRDGWVAAGRPSPLAFVWERDGATIKVTVISHAPKNWNPAVAYGRISYCYNTEGAVSRIRAIWHVPITCEFLFPCALLTDRQFFVGGQSLAVNDWVFTPDGTIQKLRDGKDLDDYFDPSSWLSVDDLHLKKWDELPFTKLRTSPPRK